MPRSYRRKRRRKRARRRYAPNPRDLMISTRGPVPLSYKTKMRYATNGIIDAGVGTPANVLYRANDLYDPEQAVGGHQPLGFDQFVGTLYDHFTVLGSKITVDFVSADSTYLGGARCGINVTDDASGVVTTFDTVVEQGGCAHGILTNMHGQGRLRLTKTFSTKKFFNRADVKDCSELRGNAAASPTEQAYFNVFCQGLASGTNPANLYVNVLIEYIVLLQEPKQLAQS